jgi:hypothetical protein
MKINKTYIKYFTAQFPLDTLKDDVLKLAEADELLIEFARLLCFAYAKLNVEVYYQHLNIVITEHAYIVVLPRELGQHIVNEIKGA